MEGLAAQLADVGHLRGCTGTRPRSSSATGATTRRRARLQWVQWQTPEGATAKTALVRIVGDPPLRPSLSRTLGALPLRWACRACI